MHSNKYDVVIVGAGPAGATAAFYLAKHGVHVVLLDKAIFPREKTCGDGLTPRAVSVLDDLGLLPDLLQTGFKMDEATVFAPNGTPVTTQMPIHTHSPPLMIAIPRIKLDNMILQKAVAAGAELMEGVNIGDVEMQDAGVTVVGKQKGRTLQVNGRIGIIAVGVGMGLLKRIGILKEAPTLTLAARTYYEGVVGLNGRFEFYFEGIPLPGYGWVFPLSDTTANIGAGIFEIRRRRQKKQTAQAVLDQFIQIPKMQQMLANAKQIGPVRGYPIRTDFAHAPTYAQNLMLVGEAAGLVNPLTGEGVDYALESGKIAAHHLLNMFAANDFSPAQFAGYDQKLRDHFHEQVLFCERIRDWYLHKPIINRLVKVARKQDNFRELFTDIVLGNVPAKEALSARTILQILFN